MHNKKLSFKGLLQVLKESFSAFGEDKVTKLSGSLAYSTVFSLGPLIILIISLCGLFLGREAAQGEIYAQLKNFVGRILQISYRALLKMPPIRGIVKWLP